VAFKYFNVKNGLVTGNILLHAGNGVVSANTFTGNISVTDSANLGNVSNVKITGGANGYVLTTDGTGNLSWSSQQSGSANTISNGNSNVSIGTANGNVTISVGGTSNTVVFSNSGVLIDGTGNITGNLVVGNVTTTLIGGTLTTGAQPNITQVGTLGNLAVTGNTTTSNLTVSTRAVLGSISGVSITGGSNGYVMTTDGSGNLSWAALGALITHDSFSGNGVQTTFTLSSTPASENYTLININGATQLKSSYSLSGANIVFSEAPPNGSSIEVTTFGQKPTTSGYVNRKYVGNGSANTYTVTSGCSETDVLVFLNGICQMPVDDYTISGSNLTFQFNVANGVSIQIRELPR